MPCVTENKVGPQFATAEVTQDEAHKVPIHLRPNYISRADHQI